MAALGILGILISVATFIIFILVLIKLFQAESVGKGILGLICALYTFIWGWQNHEEQGITQIMWVWTGLIILSIVLNGAATAVTQ